MLQPSNLAHLGFISLCVILGISCSQTEKESFPASPLPPPAGQDHDTGQRDDESPVGLEGAEENTTAPNYENEEEDHPLDESEFPEDLEDTESTSNWIGSPCTNNSQCDYEGSYCLNSNDGYPGGSCSQDCSLYCPDEAGNPISFCIQAPEQNFGQCMSRCDLDFFPNNQGCRDGYQCAFWPRNNEPTTIQHVCVPQGWDVSQPCLDPTNLEGEDDCYFHALSFGHSPSEALARAIMEGTSTSDQALEFLDLNYAYSQLFIEEGLNRTIHPNFTSGHHSTQPMKGMIVHYTAAQKEDGTIKYFVSESPHASTHFVVGSYRNGLVVQIFSHEDRTWHAGSTYNRDRFGFDFANAGYLNPTSGGGWEDYAEREYTLNLPLHGTNPIQITDGIPGTSPKYANKEFWQPYTYYQVLSYILVGRALHQVYDFNLELIQRHGDVASSRIDPGPAFPLTWATALIFNTENLFEVEWLNQYKVQANWIVNHPQAR